MSDDKKENVLKPNAAKPAAKGDNSQTGQAIYLGPPMVEQDKSGQLTFQIGYGAIFNGVSPQIAQMQKANADFSKLFIPVGEAAKAMRELTDKNSALFAVKKKVTNDYLSRKKGGR
ncbi:MAG: hypothetical protein FWF51_12040 [Chitinivibrionia bacterium]|nr:hypothetical protein [Chitinivibrionia bacterium]